MTTMENTAREPGPAVRAPATSSGYVVSKDGTRIAYDRLGNGPPVILVVGALCSRTFGPSVKLAPRLARRFTVFNYDRRGRGESGEDSPYQVAREIEDIQALIELAGGSACIFGHSSGAVLALRAAAHGLAIDKLALYEAPLIVDHSRASTDRDWVQIERSVAAERRDDAVKSFLKSIGMPGFAISLMKWTPIWRKITALAHTLPYDGEIVRDLQRGEPLPAGAWTNVTIPTLVLHGGRSPGWMKNGTLALAKALPNAKFRVLEGQTHDVSPKVLMPVLSDFFTNDGLSAAARLAPAIGT